VTRITHSRINTAYNKFLNQLVLWSYLYRRVEADKKRGFSSVKNYEKMISFKEKVQELLPDMEKLDRSKIRSYYPLVDDVALIQCFKNTIGNQINF
jgi:predicted transcriptional regulator